MTLLDDFGLHLQRVMKGLVKENPAFSEGIYALVNDVAKTVGVVPILEVENHIAELRAYVREKQATGIVVVHNGHFDEPERGPTRAVLTVVLGKDGQGWASAWPYLVAGAEFHWAPEEIRDPALVGSYLDPYRTVFA